MDDKMDSNSKNQSILRLLFTWKCFLGTEFALAAIAIIALVSESVFLGSIPSIAHKVLVGSLSLLVLNAVIFIVYRLVNKTSEVASEDKSLKEEVPVLVIWNFIVLLGGFAFLWFVGVVIHPSATDFSLQRTLDLAVALVFLVSFIMSFKTIQKYRLAGVLLLLMSLLMFGFVFLAQAFIGIG